MSMIKTRQKMKDSWLLLQRITNHKTQTRCRCLLSAPWAEAGCTGYAEAWASNGAVLPAPWHESGTRPGHADRRFFQMGSECLV